MITGFKWDVRGAQRTYNVISDLYLGKGNRHRFSVCALTGKREIMNLGDNRRQQNISVSLTAPKFIDCDDGDDSGNG